MQVKDLNLAGAIAYWSLSEGTDLEKLRTGFTEAGLAECVPDRLEDKPALRRALQHTFPSRSHRIHPLEGRKGFAVGRLVEQTDSNELVWEQELLVRLVYPESAGGAARLAIRSDNDVLKTSIRRDFASEKERVPASRLGQMLVRAVESLKGISLRPSGGFYWLAEEDQERWQTIAATVEQVNHGNSMYLLKTTTDPDTLEAICDAVIHQVESKLDTLVADLGQIDEGDKPLGKRALETRRQTAEELHEFAERYEDLFDFNLQRLRDKADEVAATALVAIQSAS